MATPVLQIAALAGLVGGAVSAGLLNALHDRQPKVGVHYDRSDQKRVFLVIENKNFSHQVNVSQVEFGDSIWNRIDPTPANVQALRHLDGINLAPGEKRVLVETSSPYSGEVEFKASPFKSGVFSVLFGSRFRLLVNDCK